MLLDLRELEEQLSGRIVYGIAHEPRILELVDILKKATPGYPEGNVWKSWNYSRRKLSKGLVIEIFNDNPVAYYLEFGTAPHTIKPRKAKILHLDTPGWDGPKFLATVDHPGTRPTLFATKAFLRWGAANPDLLAFTRVKVGHTIVG